MHCTCIGVGSSSNADLNEDIDGVFDMHHAWKGGSNSTLLTLPRARK